MKRQLETEWKKRQYMEEKDYEIYYYNDYNLSPVRAHSHNYYEIYFFLEGDAEMNAEEQVFWPKPGEVLVIRRASSLFCEFGIMRNLTGELSCGFRQAIWKDFCFSRRITDICLSVRS